MRLITIEQARDHVRADGDDDELLTTYCDSAETVCAKIANRSLFATAAELAAAVAAIPDQMIQAYAAYDAAVVDANAQDDDRIKGMKLGLAQVALDKATIKADADAHGLTLDAVENKDIISAILLTVGHLYRNRENVSAGQGAAAVEVPMTAQNIMEMHRWIGPL
jgi:hypothetical protein